MKLLIASNNKGKLREIKQILGSVYEEIVTPKEIDGIVKASALLLARALNQALHPRLPKEMKELLSSQS